MAVFDAVICKHFSVHVKKHCFLILHGMVLTHALWNETFLYFEVPSSFLVNTVQTLSKSVYNCLSYWQKFFRGTFLWPTVYIPWKCLSVILSIYSMLFFILFSALCQRISTCNVGIVILLRRNVFVLQVHAWTERQGHKWNIMNYSCIKDLSRRYIPAKCNCCDREFGWVWLIESIV